MTKKSRNQSPADKQAPMTGKVENDFNKEGEQAPTQKHEGRRTPQSRSDRESQIGSDNQSNMRRGTTSHAPNKGR